MRVHDTEALVIGSGIAGLSAALALEPMHATILTKTAGPIGGCSPLAQGGIAAALGPDDHPALHARDTIAAGGGLVDAAMAHRLAAEGVERVRALIAAGLPVDRDAAGRPALGREAAHGRDRIVHAHGDATGREVVSLLAAAVAGTPRIRVETGASVVDIVVIGGRVAGALACHADGWVLHRAPRLILATGGVGAAYARTTNPPEATGDGLCLAARAGARLGGLEFVQFHPTALAGDGDPAPLLTEALRGAGAHLTDAAGRRFMVDEHPLADLAPRDVVARAVHRRVCGGDPVFLDLRPALERAPDGFPVVLAICAAAGYDPTTAPVPVAPAAHFHMGGVVTDADGRTSVPGLWACGEVACTGVHGANRLASNSLLEGLVFGTRAGRDAAASRPAAVPRLGGWKPPRVPRPDAAGRVADLVATARALLGRHAGIARNGDGLSHCAGQFDGLAALLASLSVGGTDDADATVVRPWMEARSRLVVGRLITRAALARGESRGAHFRTDRPAPTRPPPPTQDVATCPIPC